MLYILDYYLSLNDQEQKLFSIICLTLLVSIIIIYIILNYIKNKYENKIENSNSKIINFIFNKF